MHSKTERNLLHPRYGSPSKSSMAKSSQRSLISDPMARNLKALIKMSKLPARKGNQGDRAKSIWDEFSDYTDGWNLTIF